VTFAILTFDYHGVFIHTTIERQLSVAKKRKRCYELLGLISGGMNYGAGDGKFWEYAEKTGPAWSDAAGLHGTGEGFVYGLGGIIANDGPHDPERHSVSQGCGIPGQGNG